MTKKLYPEESVQAIADAIRAKTGKTDTMTIGEMAGEVEEIDLNAWRDAYIVGTIDKIRTSITTMRKSYYLFFECPNLTKLVLTSETLVENISSTVFANGSLSTGYIYVPSALIEDYKVATNWSTFASQFRAIEDYPDEVTW